MFKPYLRTATADDCAELAINLRDADLKEIAMGGSSGPYESLMRGVVNSDNPQAVIGPEGDVIALLGIVTVAPSMGSPWMLASDGLEGIKRVFLRECRGWLEEAHKQYPTLYNEVWQGNTLHIRWLKWLGFTVSDSPLNRPNFLTFWKSTYV